MGGGGSLHSTYRAWPSSYDVKPQRAALTQKDNGRTLSFTFLRTDRGEAGQRHWEHWEYWERRSTAGTAVIHLSGRVGAPTRAGEAVKDELQMKEQEGNSTESHLTDGLNLNRLILTGLVFCLFVSKINIQTGIVDLHQGVFLSSLQRDCLSVTLTSSPGAGSRRSIMVTMAMVTGRRW